jgi:hypothetical protein
MDDDIASAPAPAWCRFTGYFATQTSDVEVRVEFNAPTEFDDNPIVQARAREIAQSFCDAEQTCRGQKKAWRARMFVRMNDINSVDIVLDASSPRAHIEDLVIYAAFDMANFSHTETPFATFAQYDAELAQRDTLASVSAISIQ